MSKTEEEASEGKKKRRRLEKNEKSAYLLGACQHLMKPLLP